MSRTDWILYPLVLCRLDVYIVFMNINKKGRERTREIVRIRDEYICQDCHARRTPDDALRNGKRLFDVHHLNGLCGKKSRGYDKVSEIDGLITLCHKCHFSRHDFNGHDSKKNKEKRLRIVSLYEEIKNMSEVARRVGLSRQRIHQIVRYK